MMHNGTDCSGPPYCNTNPFAWGQQPDGLTYPANFGPGGQAHLRYAQTMCDEGWCKQLGSLGQLSSGRRYIVAALLGAGVGLASAAATSYATKRRRYLYAAGAGAAALALTQAIATALED
jgi:hypothetical protein